MRTLLEQAARNNAKWHDAVCRAHGIPTEVHEHIWLTRRPAPRFYANAVTLSGTVGTPAQRRDIKELLRGGTLGNWAVKDSFGSLDLTGLGFHILFEAMWICRTPSLARPEGAIDGVGWTRVKDPPELATWEEAWAGESASNAPRQPRVFREALLADGDLVFIAGYDGDRIVAGAIGNRTGDVVGLSNVFTPESAAARYWAGCVAEVIGAFPGLPLVGYERGLELEAARGLGFADLGPLRVWTK